MNIKEEMVVTLTWIGEDYKLNLVAQIFNQTSTTNTNTYFCKAGYFNPMCKGLSHLRSKDVKVMGETL